MSIADLSQVTWRKSSYSGNGPNCVEIGVWRKSSYSSSSGNCVEVSGWRKSSYSGSGSNCVEVANAGVRLLTRDSKNPTGPVLAFTTPHWDAFRRATDA